MNRTNCHHNSQPPAPPRRVWLLPAAWLLALALLAGQFACSSDTDPAAAKILEPAYGTDAEGARYVGSDRCLACHEEVRPVEAATYLASRHATPGTVGADADPACLACHDPIGDGIMLAPWFADHDHPPAGMTAVGCESCHGAGTLHWLNFPAHPNPTPDYQACGQCHRALPPGHAALAGQGSFSGKYANDILAKYEQSAHGRWSYGDGPCLLCHSDEGFRGYFEKTAGMDRQELYSFMAEVPYLPETSVMQCRTCHDGHTGELRGGPTVVEEDGVEVVKYSRLFNLCTACHQVFLEADYDPKSGAYDYFLDTGRIPFHGELDGVGLPVADSLVIWDTHFATRDGAITGWPIDPASEQACLGCHDPHLASKFW
ncbi:hypothetical protein [Desulfurivibrio alkaliphilus]|uniref:Uncharacterized protein n=1 Tax=Desulfurivibrio alkaliphilus (strain DSM 19089 / UNIQEM U267 / AHT2) TaxID=589865 RepID=D6Z6V0_DESAT|nr:hypothetical protein [Desulfurivibrio alkaliphilus]ADH86937.1 hypothetical protein DaAHT2_2272 [Desulfurivibrio alkaliphilus AHT 2]